MNDNPITGLVAELSMFAAFLVALALTSGDKATRAFALFVVLGGSAVVALLIAVFQ